MFRSQTDHHQGGTILFLTSVTNFYLILLIDVAACPVVMCVLSPVLSCYCYDVPGHTRNVIAVTILQYSAARAIFFIYRVKTQAIHSPPILKQLGLKR